MLRTRELEMSLSQRLKQAEDERRRWAGPPAEPAERTDEPAVASAPPASVILGDEDEVVVDLTERVPMGGGGIAYDPVRNGDATSAFGDPEPVLTDRTTTVVCPRCGGPTQVDLVDQVHQTTSLSCLDCFHMFRVDSR
jgi:hypothetical protein